MPARRVRNQSAGSPRARGRQMGARVTAEDSLILSFPSFSLSFPRKRESRVLIFVFHTRCATRALGPRVRGDDRWRRAEATNRKQRTSNQTGESGSERIPRSLLRVSERMMLKIPSLGIEDSPELAPESFNPPLIGGNPQRRNPACECSSPPGGTHRIREPSSARAERSPLRRVTWPAIGSALNFSTK